MSIISSVNNLGQTTDDPTCRWGYVLKETLKSAGWIVAGSGDGLSAFEMDGATAGSGGHWDVITTAGVWQGAGSPVANNWGNKAAWYVMRSPDGLVEVLVQRDADPTHTSTTYAAYVYIGVSITSFSSAGANATTPPAVASGEEEVLGTAVGRVAANFSNSGFADAYHHCVASDVAIEGAWPFVVFMNDTAGQVRGFLMIDPVAPTDENDLYPWVVYHSSFEPDMNNMDVADPIAPRSPLYNIEDNTYRWTNVGVSPWADNSGIGLTPGNLKVSPDGKSRSLPVVYTLPYQALWKGISAWMWWNGIATRDYPDTNNLATANAEVYINDFLFPWEQGTTPSGGTSTAHTDGEHIDIVSQIETIDQAPVTTVYVNRVWDPTAVNFVRWETPTPDIAGASYPGPSAFGATSDFVVEAIK